MVGFDVFSGEPIDPTVSGIYDNTTVKRQILHSAPIIASQLLLVDEVIHSVPGTEWQGLGPELGEVQLVPGLRVGGCRATSPRSASPAARRLFLSSSISNSGPSRSSPRPLLVAGGVPGRRSGRSLRRWGWKGPLLAKSKRGRTNAAGDRGTETFLYVCDKTFLIHKTVILLEVDLRKSKGSGRWTLLDNCPNTTAGRHADRLCHHGDLCAVHVEYDVLIASNGWTGCARRSK